MAKSRTRIAARESCLALVALIALGACTPPQIPTEALKWSLESAEVRTVQTRRFQTADEEKLLAAGAAILQEMGFIIDAREPKLGVLVGSKRQPLDSLGEKATSIAVAVLTRQVGLPYGMPVSKEQLIKAALVTRPGENKKETIVRVTFQRVVWNTEDKISGSELLQPPELYRAFFVRLAEAVSLEARDF
jgi:hypothetical protein